MTEILEFPFDSGAYEATDRKWLPANVLAVAENVRLDRDGRLVVRPGATALSLATMSTNTLTAYDLGNYSSRLVALGTQITGSTCQTDLFEYVASAAKWRGTSGENISATSGVRLPTLTDIREVGLLPDQGDSVRHVSLAASSTYICAVIGRSTESAIHIFDPTTNQTLVMTDVALRLARVVFAGSTFWIYGVDADEDICRVSFDPSTDETVSSISTLVSNATTVVDLAVSAFGTGSAVAWGTASTAEVYTYTSAGAAVTNWTGLATGASSVALIGNSAGTLITLGYQAVATALYFAKTFDQTGVLQNGPTALFSGAGGSGVRLGAAFTGTGTNIRFLGVDDVNHNGLHIEMAQTNHGFQANSVYYDARPVMAPVVASSQVFMGWQDDTATRNTLGTFHLTGTREMPQCFLAHQLLDSQGVTENLICNACVLGTKLYIPVVQLAENTGNANTFRFAIYEAETAATARRQMAEVGGELLIAGGMPMAYDGRVMCEVGFAECPIIAASSGGGTSGGLEELSTYQAKVVWKAYNGRKLVARSQPSPPFSHTLTTTDNYIDWIVTTPHSLRRHRAFEDQNITVVVELYRTVANGANFQLDVVAVVDPADDEAERVTIRSTRTDAQLADNLILYSDESGMEIAAPYPCRYVWPGRDRALTGGLPETETWFYSDLLIPGRQVSFPALFFQGSYIRRANQPITAVGSFETVGVVWTQDEIAQIPGRGPERSGAGEFDSMLAIATPGGCIDWRSLVSTPAGFFFQMATDKLMLLTRGPAGGGAGEVQWIGQPIRETLASYPVITAAVHIRTQMAVAFACNATDGLSGRILIYDMRRQMWFVDNVSGPITALAELDGRLVYLSNGAIYQYDAAPGSGTFIAHSVQTGLVRITKALGWGHIYRVGLLGHVLGACTVEAFIDYDDGTGFRTLGSETFTGSEGTVEKLWSLNIQKTSRFALKFSVTHSSTGSAGIRLNGWAVEVDGSKNMVRVGSTGHVA